MREELSYGVIPVLYTADGWRYLILMQHKSGMWSFPKGHYEAGETPEQTARRELLEETGITKCDLQTDQLYTIQYAMTVDGVRQDKTVAYYLGFITTEDVVVQPTEIDGYFFGTYDEICQRMDAHRYTAIRPVVIKVEERLRQR